MKKKLAIITTHPIQYYAPLFRILSQSETLEVKVFYTKGKVESTQYEPDFGKSIAWDIPLLEGYDYQFIENRGVKPSGFWSIQNPNLIAEIQNWGAESVLVFGWSYQSHLQAIRHFKGKIPVFFRGDSTLLDEKPGLKTTLRRVFLKWVYRYIDIALYVGTENKQYYLKHGLKEIQLIFAPHAVDNHRFYDSDDEFQKKADRWRLDLGIRSEEKVFLFVGKFTFKKNPMLLLKAFQELKIKSSHLIFVGNGELEMELKTTAKNVSNIHFISFQNQSQMPVVYRLGNVFCLPSQGPGETWGLAVNEAMASGNAILVSDKCGCAADLVSQGENGYVFESNNQRQLSEIMEKILDEDLINFKNKSLEIIEKFDFLEIKKAIESAN